MADRTRREQRTPAGRLISGRRGTAALEFALIGVPFLFMLIFCFEIAYDYFAQAALDWGVQSAARAVQVGTAQGLASAADFRTKFLCPALGSLLPCSQVFVNVQVVPNSVNGQPANFYQNGLSPPTIPLSKQPDTNTFCPGLPGQLMLVQAIYPGPSFVYGFIPALNPGSVAPSVHLTLSTAAFVNEPFTPASAQPKGC